jgi:hypothetical protein
MAEEGHYKDIAAVQLYGDEERPDRSKLPSHMDRIQDPREFQNVGVPIENPQIPQRDDTGGGE